MDKLPDHPAPTPPQISNAQPLPPTHPQTHPNSHQQDPSLHHSPPPGTSQQQQPHVPLWHASLKRLLPVLLPKRLLQPQDLRLPSLRRPTHEVRRQPPSNGTHPLHPHIHRPQRSPNGPPRSSSRSLDPLPRKHQAHAVVRLGLLGPRRSHNTRPSPNTQPSPTINTTPSPPQPKKKATLPPPQP